MNKEEVIMIYSYEIHGVSTTIKVCHDSVRSALSAASRKISAFWIHRVEVWRGDFRILLQVH